MTPAVGAAVPGVVPDRAAGPFYSTGLVILLTTRDPRHLALPLDLPHE